MQTYTTVIRSLLILMMSVTLVCPAGPVQAGILSTTAGKIAARRAGQRAAIQAAEKRIAVQAVEKKTASQAVERATMKAATKDAEKTVLAESRAKAHWASGQERKGLMSRAERARYDYRYNDLRNNNLPVKRLGKEHQVNRYYKSQAQARAEMREGIPAGRHVTASESGRVGRPIEGASAQARYGLAYQPKARVTATLPKNTPVRQGKVIGGHRGYGQIVPQQRIRPENISEFRLLH